MVKICLKKFQDNGWFLNHKAFFLSMSLFISSNVTVSWTRIIYFSNFIYYILLLKIIKSLNLAHIGMSCSATRVLSPAMLQKMSGANSSPTVSVWVVRVFESLFIQLSYFSSPFVHEEFLWFQSVGLSVFYKLLRVGLLLFHKGPI